MRSPEKVVDISEYRHQYQLRLEKRQKKAKLPISVNGQSRMVDKSSPIKKSSYLVFNNWLDYE